MDIQNQMVNNIELLTINTSIERLQTLFSELPYNHLPVVNDNIYVGCISEHDALSFEAEKPVGDYRFALEAFFIRDTDNWLEALNAFAQHDTNLLPVLNKNNVYLGHVELEEIVSLFTETPFLGDTGNIITLEKPLKDYSFSEICQIVESNGAHVLGGFLSKVENDLAQITVKVSATSFNALLQAFRRYDYRIISQHLEDSFQTNLDDRKQYLEKYLNI